MERKALESLVSLQPGDTAAIERLATLAAVDGDKDRAAALRHKKAAIDAATDQYRALISQPDLPPHAVELAHLAEKIGRRFDARAWWTLATRRDSSIESEATPALARLSQPQRPIDNAGGTLAGLLEPTGSLTAEKVVRLRPPALPMFADESRERRPRFQV